jgi:hypothetical protein
MPQASGADGSAGDDGGAPVVMPGHAALDDIAVIAWVRMVDQALDLMILRGGHCSSIGHKIPSTGCPDLSFRSCRSTPRPHPERSQHRLQGPSAMRRRQ